MASRLEIRSAPRAEGVFAGNTLSGTVTNYAGRYQGWALRSSLIWVRVPTVGTATVGTNRVVLEYQEFGTEADGALFTVEFPDDYAGEPIPLIDGVTIALNVGGVVSAGGFMSFDAVPANRLPPEFFELTEDEGLAIYLQQNDLVQGDTRFDTSDGRTLLIHRAVKRAIAVTCDLFGIRSTVTRNVMEAKRQLVTIGENYDRSTLHLFRGGLSYSAMIGNRGTTTRAADLYPYRDPLSGRYKTAAAAQLGGKQCPMAPGYQQAIGIFADTREVVPLVHAHVGRAFEVGQDTKNLLPHWKTMQEQNGLASVYWAAGGGAASSGFSPYRGVLDPEDSAWPSRWTTKVLRSTLPTAGVSYIQSEEGAVGAATHVVGGIWARGTGQAKLQVLTGTSGAATNLLHEVTVILDPSEWHLIASTDFAATIPGGHTHARLRLLANVANTVVETDICTLNPVAMLPAFLPSDGVAKTLQASDYTHGTPLPTEGFMFFAIQNSAEGGGGVYDLVRAGAANFLIQRDFTTGAEQWLWYTASGGTPLVIADGDWGWYRWKTIALAWRPSSGTPGELERYFYVDGALVGSDQTASYTVTWNTPTLFGGAPLGAGLPAHGIRFQELRVDSGLPGDDAIALMHDRLDDADFFQTNIDVQGRYFRVMSESAPWRHPTAPNQIQQSLGLQEHDAHDPSTVFGR